MCVHEERVTQTATKEEAICWLPCRGFSHTPVAPSPSSHTLSHPLSVS